MTSAQIRQSFLDFFRSKQHTIVASSSLLPDAPNLLFTNAGMNQFVPIFLGQARCPYTPGRAADTQKCIRAGGKHNDLDDVGLDTYHHTFFEMLGNWSFGDYFKKETIEWAWELVVGIWKFPPTRLYATVYKPGKGDPSEFDQDAWNFWAEKFCSVGLDPAVHVVNGNKKDNFWMMGETGPCGPCSELHVDLTPAGDTKGALVNKGDARCIEIWNLVFIQFNAQPVAAVCDRRGDSEGDRRSQTAATIEFVPLAQQHVDTGMGFERVTSIIQGTKGFSDFKNAKISNYETDIFRPIFDAIEKLSGTKYGSTLPTKGGTGDSPVSVGDLPNEASRRGTVALPAQAASGATYSRRNLPHFEKPWVIYHITINTIPSRQLSAPARDVVFDCVLHWRESRYRLVAACVMPDHAHFIIQPGVKAEDKFGKPIFWPLSEILHSIKSYSAKEANKMEGKTGPLWQEERYDRYMRSNADLQEKFHYLCRNPWEAGLVQENEPWPWLWTPDIEASKPYVPLVQREGRKSDPSVADDDIPTGTAGQVARQDGPVARATQIQIDVAFRVVADHIRTLSFAIADGIQPGNNDRNYVLRRILRRAVRYGRTLGFHEPFFYKLVDVLADTMGDVFPEIRAKKKHVQDVIRTEEEAFNKTLDRGIERFSAAFHTAVKEHNYRKIAESGKKIRIDFGQFHFESTPVSKSGADHQPDVVIDLDGDFARQLHDAGLEVPVFRGSDAFELYDTYGFPLDLTELMARERGLTVDKEGFEKLMEEQRARARAAQKKEVISLSQIETTTPTKFVGFDKLETEAKVVEVVSLKDKTAVVFDTSVCYAEMGGQVGDTGKLEHGSKLWRVLNTQKSGSTWLHFVEEGVARATGPSGEATRVAAPAGGSPTGTGESPVLPIPGDTVTLVVDRPRREAIQRHHTVTHLFHWALHEVVSRDATQKGSFVGPDKLTFDFNSAALTPQQVADIEKLVNERILENAGVSWIEVPYAEVKSRKDVMQFFGDKYGDTVRVVQIGGRAGELNGYSMELCGGTHTRATGEIGLFRIVGESAIAAGVRRVEAVAGLQAYDLANQQLHLLRNVAGQVNSPIQELEKKIETLLAHQKELEKQVKITMQRNASNAASELLGRAQTVNGVPLITHNLGDADGDFLQAIADALKGRFKGVVVLGGCSNNAVTLVATVSHEFTAKVQAGKIIQQIAPIVGGKGGGKPDNARGGGKDASKLDEALAKAADLLK
ncbi:MAG TPA: alanine--tRNA ligase-related protein [Candidatus Angelobacter sp.]|nr:alanine--tRNA ligase-related protein [Candidatus Angelobacter sp.]